MRTIRCADGCYVRVDGLSWLVPESRNYLGDQDSADREYCWGEFPVEIRQEMMQMGEYLLGSSSYALFRLYFAAAKWLCRYWDAAGYSAFQHWTETEWGAFAEWLSHQIGRRRRLLTLAAQRSYMEALKLGMEAASSRRAGGIQEEDVESIATVIRRRYRDSNLLRARHSAERAWTEEERTNLLRILREEWLAWKDWHSTTRKGSPRDLLVVTAAYLCWEETFRPEEINSLTVDDIEFGERTYVTLRAPNKDDSRVQVDATSSRLLDAVVSWGSQARFILDTRRLFVEPTPHPRFVGTPDLDLRLRALLEEYHDKYPIDRPDAILADGRKTLGSLLAARTNDEGFVSDVLRHARRETTKVYYIRQGNVERSRNVRRATDRYALRLSMAYNPPVLDPIKEAPAEVVDVLQRNPNHNLPYGVCSHDVVREGECVSMMHCAECPKLIPMESKIGNFIRERDLYISLADAAYGEGDLKAYQRRTAFAAVLDAHILNIRRKVG